MDKNLMNQKSTGKLQELQTRMKKEDQKLDAVRRLHSTITVMLIINTVWLMTLTLVLIYKFK